jgi:hypothetical protein
MNLKGCRRKQLWHTFKILGGSGHGLILRYYPGICRERLKKTTINLSQDSQSPEI